MCRRFQHARNETIKKLCSYFRFRTFTSIPSEINSSNAVRFVCEATRASKMPSRRAGLSVPGTTGGLRFSLVAILALQLLYRISQTSASDADSDGIDDSSDSCVLDPDNDADSDSICSNDDSCDGDVDNDSDSDNLCSDVYDVYSYSELSSAVAKLTDDSRIRICSDISVSSPIAFVGLLNVTMSSCNASETVVLSAPNYGQLMSVSGCTLRLEGMTFGPTYLASDAVIQITGSSEVDVFSCSFTSNSATYYTLGGAIYVYNSVLRAYDTVFSSNTAYYSKGAALYSSYGTLYFERTLWTGNYVSNRNEDINKYGYGGAIYAQYGTLTLVDSAFTSNSCGSRYRQIGCDGGAIYALGVSISMQRTSFTSHQVWRGAALYLSGSSLQATHCAFESNKALTNFGAISAISSSSLQLVECNFSSNSRLYFETAGHDIYTDSTSTVSIESSCAEGFANTGSGRLDCNGCERGNESSLFVPNSCTICASPTNVSAGSTFCPTAPVDVENSSCTGSFSTWLVTSASSLSSAVDALCDGDTIELGADIVVSSQVSIMQVSNLTIRSNDTAVLRTLSGNSLTRVLLISASSVVLENIALTEGSVLTNHGHAMFVTDQSSVSMHNCLVTDNGNWYYNYGTVYVTESTLTAFQSTFEDNTVRYGKGAGIYAASSTLSLEETTFVGNAVTNMNELINYYGHGGALYLTSSTVTVLNSVFDSNTCSARTQKIGCDGGAIYSYGGSLAVTGCTFKGHSVYRGGAIFADYGSVEVSFSTFSNNAATEYAGALRLRSSATITECDFDGNSPDDIYALTYTPTVRNCTSSPLECNMCTFEQMADDDSDSLCFDTGFEYDSCPADAGNDIDSDMICADIDSCPFDAGNDVDSDSICGDVDCERMENLVLGQCAVAHGGAGNVAAGNRSVVGGGEVNLAAGVGAVVGGGLNNTASANSASVCGGIENQARGSATTVAGGRFNVATGYGAVVGGGGAGSSGNGGNTAGADWTVVAGGYSNAAAMDFGFVGGGSGNTASGMHAVVSGGYNNSASSNATFVGGGGSNVATGTAATVAGGTMNAASGAGSFVGGGYHNAGREFGSVVVGGDSNAVTGYASFIGGGKSNTVNASFAVIGGGLDQRSTASYGTVAGGNGNIVTGTGASVGGGFSNRLKGLWSVVAGGYSNTAAGHWSSVGGGQSNAAAANHSFVGGGKLNTVLVNHALIGGGRSNFVTGFATFIGGGTENTATSKYSVIAGGLGNIGAGVGFSFVGGGWKNTATGYYSQIAGGTRNVVSGVLSTCGGGRANTAATFGTTVGGGTENRATNSRSTVGGGYHNFALDDYVAIGGGHWNYATGYYATVAGGSTNSAVDSRGAAVLGGFSNKASDARYAIVGGYRNTVTGPYSSILGGGANSASDTQSVVCGGYGNSVHTSFASIGGGLQNTANGKYAVIDGGHGNIATGELSSISGGANNVAFGNLAFVGGGHSNTVHGAQSVIIGAFGVASHHSAAVFSFSPNNASCFSNGNSTVSVCASNGLFVNGWRIDNVTAENAQMLRSQGTLLSRQDTLLEALFDNDTVVWNELNAVHSKIDALEVDAKLNVVRDNVLWLERNVTTVDDDLEGLQAAVVEVNQSLLELESLDVAVLQMNISNFDNMLSDYRSIVATIDTAVQVLHVDVAGMNESIMELQWNVSSQQSFIDALAQTSLEHAVLINETGAGLVGLYGVVAALNTSLDWLNGNSTLQIANARTNFDKLNASVSEQSTTIDELKRDASILMANASVQQGQITSVAANVASLNTSMHDHSTSLERLQSKVLALQHADGNHSLDQQQLWINATLQQSQLNELGASVALNGKQIARLPDNVTSQAELDDVRALLAEGNGAISRVNDTVVGLQAVILQLIATDAEVWDNVTSQHAALDHVQADLEIHNRDFDLLSSVFEQLNETVTSHNAKIQIVNATTEAEAFKIEELNALVTQQQDTISAQKSEIDKNQFRIGMLNQTVEKQERVIEQLTSSINVMNATNAEQRLQIDGLQSTVGLMNSSLASLTSMVEQMMKATTFVVTTESIGNTVGADCASDGVPCATTAMATAEVLTEAVGRSVRLQACYGYPCDEVEELLAWDREVTVFTELASDATEFTFELNDGEDMLWQHVGNSRFASFVPSNIGVVSTAEYWLSVTVEFHDGSFAEDVVTGLTFASPPTLHSVSVERVNGSAAVNWFEIMVNASDASLLTFEYWIVDVGEGWKYTAGSGGGATTIAVASTRDFILEVSVTNSYGSSTVCEQCQTLVAPLLNASDDAVLEDVSALVASGEIGSFVLLSAIDAGGDSEILMEDFLQLLRANATTVSQDVVVLHALVQAGVVAGFANALKFIEDRIDDADLLSLYLQTIDEYGTFVVTEQKNMDIVVELDEYLSSACIANEVGSAPDGEVTTFAEESYSLSCALAEEVAIVQAGAVTFVSSVEQPSTVSISAWNGTMNLSKGTPLIAEIYGVHIDGINGDSEGVADGAVLRIGVKDGVKHLRKAISCRYYDEHSDVWSARGVVLRGIGLNAAIEASAICSSSHMTLFTIGDSTEATAVVESKLLAFADRVQEMNDIDVLSDVDNINWSILCTFIGVTALFTVVIVVSKVRGRKEAVEQGRLVFQQSGQLSKPNIMGSREFEAVLRKWISTWQAAKLVLLEMLTENAVLGLFFQWDYENVVFGSADKAVVLFGAVLMTFVSSAFLLDPGESLSSDPLIVLWSALVSAMLTNVLLLPVQHFLPFMVSNVNSVSTFSPMPLTILKRELKRLSCWKSAKRRTTNAELMLRVVVHWVGLTFSARDRKLDKRKVLHVAPKLRFMQCEVKVPTVALKERKFALDGLGVGMDGIVRFQRLFRSSMDMRREARNAEFEAWYVGMRHQRHILSTLSAAVLLVLVVFALVICLLLSGTFNADESILWAVDVTQSLVVQIFVTDPSITLLVILMKLLVSSVLLRMGKKRLRKKLEKRREAVESQLASVGGHLDVVKAKVKAWSVVRSGDTRRVMEEQKKQVAAKAECEAVLDRIVVAKAGILTKRRNEDEPSITQLEEWDAAEVKLKDREDKSRNTLKSIEAALEILGGDHGDVAKESKAAQTSLLNLTKKFETIKKARSSIDRAREKLDDKPQKVTKKNAIVPISAVNEDASNAENASGLTAMAQSKSLIASVRVEEESDVQKATMPVIRRAADQVATGRNVVPTATSDSNVPRNIPVVRRGARRRRRRLIERRQLEIATGDGQQNELKRIQTTAFKPTDPSKSSPTNTKRRRMTFAEIKSLQAELRAKAAKETAPRTVRKKTLDQLSPKAIRIILARRKRNMQRLAARATATASDSTSEDI